MRGSRFIIMLHNSALIYNRKLSAGCDGGEEIVINKQYITFNNNSTASFNVKNSQYRLKEWEKYSPEN